MVETESGRHAVDTGFIVLNDRNYPNLERLFESIGVSTQAASEMFRRLVADGLVSMSDGRELHLTPAGQAAADGIFRRHALLEWLAMPGMMIDPLPERAVGKGDQPEHGVLAAGLDRWR